MSKPVRLRKAAEDDLRTAVRWYKAEADVEVARRFLADVENGFSEIGRHPAMGSPRYAHDLDLPGLRSWPLGQFPYLIFYRDDGDTVDVWRVLHTHRDIPASFGEG